MEPNPDVVSAVRELLAACESGEVQAVAAVTVEQDGEIGQCLAGVSDHKPRVIFGIEAMKRDVMDGVEPLKSRRPKLFNEEVK